MAKNGHFFMENHWTISDKNDFLPQMDKVGFGRGAWEQKNQFFFEMVQIGPKGSLMIKKHLG